MAIKVFNSLTKQLENFIPLNPNIVKFYSCGPTVYDYVHIGNLRTFTLTDFINRTLKFNGFDVDFIMNLTDVGHLTNDDLLGASTGDDKVEKAAKASGKTAKEITDFYILDFYAAVKALNLLPPKKFTRATNYINEQIDLISALEQKGFTYKIDDGVYFDTSKFEKYGELSGVNAEALKEGARVEPNPQKLNPSDFALWKFSAEGEARLQEWESPWGKGFPGWHIECSAMAMKELGESIDIHAGGEDLKMIHHQNEIAQCECATNKKYVNYWVHGAFLLVNGGKMSKSEGTGFNMHDIEAKGFTGIDLRYFFMTAHYRSKLNFTWEALESSSIAVKRIYELVEGFKLGSENVSADDAFLMRFKDALNDDFNITRALALTWEMLKSTLSDDVKLATILKMDAVLGFNIEEHVGYEVPEKIKQLAKMRFQYRKSGIWDKADVLRKEIAELGYTVEDLSDDYKLKRKLS